MLPLTTVVEIAVGCVVVFMFTISISIIVWRRARTRRIRNTGLTQRGLYARGDTMTELSREEGSALRQHGQLPYGKPTEWGLLASRESLASTVLAKRPESLTIRDRVRSIRQSLPRSISKRMTQTRQMDVQLTSFSTSSGDLAKSAHDNETSADEDIPRSAVEGIMELPTEITPRNTPEQELSYLSMCEAHEFRPASTVWPPTAQRQPFGLITVQEGIPSIFDSSPTRVRAGSITNQSAGAMPDRPIPPPPPVACPPHRYLIAKNDSVMRLSAMSLATADSSILDDGLRPSTPFNGDRPSPPLPPCPTFVPFSPYDVGRSDCNRKNCNGSETLCSPSTSLLRRSIDVSLVNTDSISPRRSLTTYHPSAGKNESIAAPRRSDTLCASSPQREPPSRLKASSKIQSPNREATCIKSTGVLPDRSVQVQNTQPQQSSILQSGKNDRPDSFYTASTSHSARDSMITLAAGFSGQKSASHVRVRDSELSSGKLAPAAMKRTRESLRKGHRRQNCIRIPSHPADNLEETISSPTRNGPGPLHMSTPPGNSNSISSASNPSSAVSSLLSPITPQRPDHNCFFQIESQSPALSEGERILILTNGGYIAKGQGSPTTGVSKHARTDSGSSVQIHIASADSHHTLPGLYLALSSAGIERPKSLALSACTPSLETTDPISVFNPDVRSVNSTPRQKYDSSPRRPMIKGPRSNPGQLNTKRYPQLPTASSPTRPSHPLLHEKAHLVPTTSTQRLDLQLTELFSSQTGDDAQNFKPLSQTQPDPLHEDRTGKLRTADISLYAPCADRHTINSDPITHPPNTTVHSPSRLSSTTPTVVPRLPRSVRRDTNYFFAAPPSPTVASPKPPSACEEIALSSISAHPISSHAEKMSSWSQTYRLSSATLDGHRGSFTRLLSPGAPPDAPSLAQRMRVQNERFPRLIVANRSHDAVTGDSPDGKTTLTPTVSSADGGAEAEMQLGMGLAIEVATPSSLYDRDGFLRV